MKQYFYFNLDTLEHLIDQLHKHRKFDELTYKNLKNVVDTIKYEVVEEPEIYYYNVISFDDIKKY